MALDQLALSRSALDRASQVRTDPELVAKLWADAGTRVIPILRGQALVLETADQAPGSGRALDARAGEGWTAVWPGWEPDLTEATFLGLDDAGVRYLAVPLPAEPDAELDAPDGSSWAGLRDVGGLLSDTEVGALVTAVAILNWHAVNRHCTRCGALTDVILGGWQRRCPVDSSEHYPRTDPAVIMAIVDADDRILLGRQAVWPEGRFSTLAGFVEPGEPLEAAVRREVLEESGVVVGEVGYRWSQPWPFPSSLMLGFRGVALTTDITVDGDELAEARWFSRAELAAGLASGALLLPPSLSIARHLIEGWYGGPLQGSDTWR